MGNVTTHINSALSVVRGTKRTRAIEEVEKDVDGLETLMHKRKRFCLTCTSQYIYKTLFEEGQGSDVTVRALDQQWKLHKVYLCQSPYFSSMFSGNWKESDDEIINIEILDENITIESLCLALGSFYKDELTIQPSEVVSLLATAILLQMDSVIEQCKTIMKESINVQTVLDYYDTSRRYGLNEIEKCCRRWLLENLLTQVIERPSILRSVSIELMQSLISSHDLYVMQTEFSVYVMLKVWVFLKLHPLWEGNHDRVQSDSLNYFRKGNGIFLLSPAGKCFSQVFRSLRLSSLIYHYVDMEMLYTDKILCPSWLQSPATLQWYNMLRIEQDKDRGPKDVSEEIFNACCTRCGRVIPANTQHIWRWTGYNFGLDLVMTHDHSLIKLKRNHRNDNVASINQSLRRNVMYRVTISSLNDQKQSLYSQTSGLQSVSLAKNEEVRVMVLNQECQYPLLLSANFLIVSPTGGPEEVYEAFDEVELLGTNFEQSHNG